MDRKQAMTISAMKPQSVSVSGYLIRELLLPVLYRRRGTPLEKFYVDVARNRASGPALPSPKIRKQYEIRDEHGGVSRQFRLGRRTVHTRSTRILYIHGGAFVFDFLSSQWRIMTGLADRLDAEVVAPLYPLAPEHDVHEGLAMVRSTYLQLVAEVGASRVAIVGDSAGGGLALKLVQDLESQGLPAPAVLLLLFPWLDLAVDGEDQPDLQVLDPLLDIDHLREAGRLWAGTNNCHAAEVSPLFGNIAHLPPTLVLVGTHDILLSDARRFAKRAPGVVLREYEGMFHGWVCAPIPEARLALDEAATFIAAHMKAVA